MSDRFFRNTQRDDDQPSDADVRGVLLQAVAEALQVVDRDIDVGTSGGGIFVGRAGVALTYLRVAQVLRRLPGLPAPPGHGLDAAQLLQKALQAVQQASPAAGGRQRLGFLDGLAGVYCVEAAVQHALGHAEPARQAAQKVLALVPSVAASPRDQCEFLYGRAGLLHGLAWLRALRVVQEGQQAAQLDDAMCVMVRQVVEEGQRSAAVDGSAAARYALMYTWHGKQYLGAAHGIAGIVHALLECGVDVEAVCPGRGARGALRTAACALVDDMTDGGNLPSSVGNASDRLVQWCHGAPGLLLCLARCVPAFGAGARCEGRRLTLGAALEAAAECVWLRGLLKKGVGLCHGIAGNGYALLAAWRAGGDAQQLRRARQYALYSAAHWRDLYNVPDRPASLYEGLCGAVCFWADCLDPERAAFPAFELPLAD